jgi:hypothetical protein
MSASASMVRLKTGAVGMMLCAAVLLIKAELSERKPYKRTELSTAQSDHLLIEFLRSRAVPSSDIGKVLKEYDEPSHVEHLGADGQHTVWTLFNAVTEASTKGSNIFQLSRRSQALHGICDSAAGLLGVRALPTRLEGVEDVEFEEAA